MKCKKVIIIGASSGIGRELAKVFSERGAVVGITARRIDLLHALQKELPGVSYVARMDVAEHDDAMRTMTALIEQMDGVDCIVLNAGIGFENPELCWNKEIATVDVNVSGFMALANVAMHYFETRGAGHIVGVSSIAAIRGLPYAPAYGASKAFMSHYMQSLRLRVALKRLPIVVTDIQPGFVDTAMGQGDGVFWVATARKAAEQIAQSIASKRAHAYVTKRWTLVAWFLAIVPEVMLKWVLRGKKKGCGGSATQ